MWGVVPDPHPTFATFIVLNRFNFLRPLVFKYSFFTKSVCVRARIATEARKKGVSDPLVLELQVSN